MNHLSESKLSKDSMRIMARPRITFPVAWRIPQLSCVVATVSEMIVSPHSRLLIPSVMDTSLTLPHISLVLFKDITPIPPIS